MKTIKYLLVGCLFAATATGVKAQELDFKTELKPIATELKANEGNPDAAKDLVKKYTKNFKKNPAALVALGEAYLMAKDFDKAKELANLAIARNKNFGAAYVLLGDVEAMKDEGGDAAMWYQQAMTMDPKNPDGYMRYANVYRKVSPEESEKTLRALKQVLPDYPVEAEAAHGYYTSGKFDKAVEYFNQSNINNLENWRLSEYATAAYLNNNKEKALEVANFGIGKFPKDISFQRIALWSNTDLQKYADAVNNAQVIFNDTCKKSTRDYTYYGLALKGEGKYQEAIDQYNKVLEMNPKEVKAYQYIAEVYQAQGNQDKALEYSQMYMDKSENTTPSDYAKLASIYVAKAKTAADADKEAIINKATTIFTNMAQKYPSIAGWAYNQAGNSATTVGLDDLGATYYQKTIDLLENKTDRDADETSYLKSAYQLIGYYWWVTKENLEKAKPYYEKLIVLDPEDKNAKAALMPAEEQLSTTGK